LTGPNAAAGPPDNGATDTIVTVPVIGASTRVRSGHDEVSTVQPDEVSAPEVTGLLPPDGAAVLAGGLVDVVDTRGAVTRGVVDAVPPLPPHAASATETRASSGNGLFRPAAPVSIRPR